MIPVVFIHSGQSNYLHYCINQAAKLNSVVLISNVEPGQSDKCSFIDKDSLRTNFLELKSEYIHLNTTPYDFELFCFERWFLLREHMKMENLNVVFYADSDVMLFSNITEEWVKFNQFSATLLHRTAAISSYFTYKAVDDFCKMVLSIYKDKSSYLFKKIAAHYKTRQECRLGGGVCDMTLFEVFHYSHEFGGGPGRIGEMMNIINDSTYDHNINAADQDFEFENGRKKIKMENGIPFVFNTRLTKNIKFNSLHFQGGAKDLIRDYYVD